MSGIHRFLGRKWLVRSHLSSSAIHNKDALCYRLGPVPEWDHPVACHFQHSRGLCSNGSFTSTQRHFCWETLTLTHNANPSLPSTTHSCLLNQYHEGDYARHSHARCLLEGQPWPIWTPAPEGMVSYFTADSSAPDNPPWLIQESKGFTSTDY